MNLIRATDLPITGGACALSLVFALSLQPGWAQASNQSPAQPNAAAVARNNGDEGVGGATPPQLRIGPGDELDISVYGVPELTQHVRFESTGDVSLPLVDRVHVAGLSSEQAESVIERRLASGGFIKDPHVSVYVKEYTTQGIVVQGQVNKPGIYPAFTQRRLSDMLLQAGGLSQTAGNKISILHAGQKAPEVVTLSDDPAQSADVKVLPGDTITVSKAVVVYVIGEVTRPGGFVLQSSDGNKPAGLSAVQAMALAAGPTHTASLNKAQGPHYPADCKWHSRNQPSVEENHERQKSGSATAGGRHPLHTEQPGQSRGRNGSGHSC